MLSWALQHIPSRDSQIYDSLLSYQVLVADPWVDHVPMRLLMSRFDDHVSTSSIHGSYYFECYAGAGTSERVVRLKDSHDVLVVNFTPLAPLEAESLGTSGRLRGQVRNFAR